MDQSQWQECLQQSYLTIHSNGKETEAGVLDIIVYQRLWSQPLMEIEFHTTQPCQILVLCKMTNVPKMMTGMPLDVVVLTTGYLLLNPWTKILKSEDWVQLLSCQRMATLTWSMVLKIMDGALDTLVKKDSPHSIWWLLLDRPSKSPWPPLLLNTWDTTCWILEQVTLSLSNFGIQRGKGMMFL